jgi:perosamine synthetase
MQYRTFDATGCDFPPPRVPVLPSLNWRSLGLQRPIETAGWIDSPNARFYSRGRYAMTDAYRMCGVGPGSALLVPSYHCRSMLDPAIRLDAELVFYPLRPDLQPDIAQLKCSLKGARDKPVALLFTHYFGFAQPVDEILDFCQQNAIALIEDCSHCLCMPSSESNLGNSGRYCVSSPYKFFPVEDGGLLRANSGTTMPAQATISQGLVQEVKGAIRTLKQALATMPTLNGEDVANRPSMPLATKGSDSLCESLGTSRYYAHSSERSRPLAISLWTMRHTDIERLKYRRRAHYARWVEAVARLPNCKALYSDLPEACVPYMFPLWISRPETEFFALKRLGVPIWRWDDIAVSTCPVATEYRTHLLHLPCHQELTATQMDWLTNTVARVMSGEVAREFH